MFQSIIVTLSLLGVITTGQPEVIEHTEKLLASRSISLEYREGVYKDNILLNMAYLRDEVKGKNFKWDEIKKPFRYEMRLKPNDVFAYHDDVLSTYKERLKMTSGAHFNYAEGFKSDGRLTGMGVCHLASLFNWAARDANLQVVSPTNHDFAYIYDIPREFGVAIYNDPTTPGANANQNLYITNNLGNTVKFVFDYKDNVLKVSVYEEIPGK